MTNRREVAKFLSEIIKKSLRIKYGKVPSASRFANEFNLRAHGTKTITNETARKWLLGLTFPEIDKLIVLSDWLEIDLSIVLKGALQQSHRSSSNLKDLTDHLDFHIQDCIKKLNYDSKKTLLLVLWMLRQLEQNNFDPNFSEKLIRDHLNACSECNAKLKVII